MAKGFNLTNRAKEGLRGIWSYTLRNWSERQADHYIATLYERFEWLTERPDVGKHRPDIHEGFYCFPHDWRTAQVYGCSQLLYDA